MNIKNIWAVYYSATGNTETITKKIAGTIAERLQIPFHTFDFTLPKARTEKKVFEDGDLVVFGTPVYAGRIPNKMLPYVQEGFVGNGALAVPVVSFGNRSFDDALIELRNELEEHGFHTIAGAAITATHAFAHALAAGRPDQQDLEQMDQFAEEITNRLKEMDEIPAPVEVPGRNPVGPYYKPLGLDGNPAVFLKAKPKTNTELCNQCGICAKVCPMGSVSAEDYSVVDGICIKCQACIKKCAQGAKYFDDEAFLSHKAMLEQTYQRRVENQFFFSEKDDCKDKMREETSMKVVARIHNDYKSKFGIPRQSGLVDSVQSAIVFEPEYRDENAVRGLSDYSHIWLLWEFSESVGRQWSPTVRPPRLGGNVRVGVFATRAPFRANPIGLSSVKLDRIEMTEEGPVLYVDGADLLDGTPIYDIKPYLPHIDCHPEATAGFAGAVKGHSLDVEIPDELLLKIPTSQQQTIVDILKQDPRPGYQDDEERIYGMTYGKWEIKFKVRGNVLSVIDIIIKKD